MVCWKDEADYFSLNFKFQRFLVPFSSKFPDLNFAPYVIYRNPYVTQTVSLGYLWYNVYIMRNGRCFQTRSLFFQPIFIVIEK